MGTGEMAQWSKELAAFIEDLGWVPSTIIQQRAAACNSSFWDSDICFWSPQPPICTW